MHFVEPHSQLDESLLYDYLLSSLHKFCVSFEASCPGAFFADSIICRMELQIPLYNAVEKQDIEPEKVSHETPPSEVKAEKLKELPEEPLNRFSGVEVD